MSFYNFKLNDPSSFTTSSPDSKSSNRFVHKTFDDYKPKPPTTNTTTATSATDSPTLPRAILPNDGRGKFAVQNYAKQQQQQQQPSETQPIQSRFRLQKPTPPQEDDIEHLDYSLPDEISAVSITSSLQAITHTYSPLLLGMLSSYSTQTSIRVVKLAGQSSWHAHAQTDEVFILLRGTITVLYRSGSGEEKSVKVIGGELLVVPMGMEHCVVAEEGTEVLLLEGCHEEV